jgi:hypothetical protein
MSAVSPTLRAASRSQSTTVGGPCGGGDALDDGNDPDAFDSRAEAPVRRGGLVRT